MAAKHPKARHSAVGRPRLHGVGVVAALRGVDETTGKPRKAEFYVLALKRFVNARWLARVTCSNWRPSLQIYQTLTYDISVGAPSISIRTRCRNPLCAKRWPNLSSVTT